MSTQRPIAKDLQKFIDRYEPTKFKVMRSGIEIRGVSNIHQAIQTAKDIIEKLKLNLNIAHSADMVSYGGFEVNLRS
ncbi:hypothetical protein [Pedobacter sp. MR22-3]|nr:hypothetical protein [Pedobacter sp. MR22-3]MCX2586507.1 hypothetical protein [Pedobacter sp. MR22-3]